MSTLMMERTGTAFPGVGVPGYGTTPTPTGVTAGINWMMVPRCTMRVERCTGGFKMTCHCEDRLAASMVQNLCTMLQGGMASCCVLHNGMPCCYFNFTMGLCRTEPTEHGCTLTCTSGDTQCCEMLQACCDCINTMLESGCTCCFLLNNTPVACGCCEPSRSPGKSRK